LVFGLLLVYSFFTYHVIADGMIRVHKEQERQESIKKLEAELDKNGWLTDSTKLLFKGLKSVQPIYRC